MVFSEILLTGHKYQGVGLLHAFIPKALRVRHQPAGCPSRVGKGYWQLHGPNQEVKRLQGKKGKIITKGIFSCSFPVSHYPPLGCFNIEFVPGKQCIQVAWLLVGCFSFLVSWKTEVLQGRKKLLKVSLKLLSFLRYGLSISISYPWIHILISLTR